MLCDIVTLMIRQEGMMELAESARRRALAWMGVVFVLGFALLAVLFGRQQSPSEPVSEDLRTFQASEPPPPPEQALPGIEYQPAPAPVVAPAPMTRNSAAVPVPDVSPTAAPGVAFNYRYAFRLP